MCAGAEVICCETVINPLEMFPHMMSVVAASDADVDTDDDDIKFLFTLRYTSILLLFFCSFRSGFFHSKLISR